MTLGARPTSHSFTLHCAHTQVLEGVARARAGKVHWQSPWAMHVLALAVCVHVQYARACVAHFLLLQGLIVTVLCQHCRPSNAGPHRFWSFQ